MLKKITTSKSKETIKPTEINFLFENKNPKVKVIQVATGMTIFKISLDLTEKSPGKPLKKQ